MVDLAYEEDFPVVPADEEEEEIIDAPLLDYLDMGNLVDELDGNEDQTGKILELYSEAKGTMEKWKKRYERALKLAKLQPSANGKDIEQKDFPFKGSSLAMMPYITEAMLDFNSRAAPELVWARDIVKVKVYGKKTPEKEARAERINTYQNYQLAEMVPDWRTQQDKAIFIIACPGTVYKETYYDSEIKEIRSDLCLADEIIFNHDYSTFKLAPDKFKEIEYTRNEVISFIRGEQKWDIEEDDLEEDVETFKFIECYTWIDLDDDGFKEPYIAIIFQKNSLIVYLTPYFDEDSIHQNDEGEIVKIDALERFTQIQFLPDPDGGPMGMGWGILLGPMFDSINSTMRQLTDAGTIANTAANSGFFATGMVSGKGNAIQSGPIESKIGQLTPIQTRGDLRNNLVQFPSSGPNDTLFKLMEFMIESARRMTTAASTVEANSQMAASLYLAQLQQALKTPNSIIMRVYEGLRIEQQKIGLLNYKHYSDKKYNEVIDDDQEASMEADYDPSDCDIRLEADPSQGSDAERSARAAAILQESKEDEGGIINKRQAVLDWLKTMKTPNIDELAPEPDPNAVDPTQQLILAQQAAEMEITKEDQNLRAGELEIKRQKMALDAAREMTKLGLDADKAEAEITNLYTQSLERLVNMGLSKDRQAFDMLKAIEDQFIDAQETQANAPQIPAGNPGPA